MKLTNLISRNFEEVPLEVVKFYSKVRTKVRITSMNKDLENERFKNSLPNSLQKRLEYLSGRNNYMQMDSDLPILTDGNNSEELSGDLPVELNTELVTENTVEPMDTSELDVDRMMDMICNPRIIPINNIDEQ